MRESGSANCLDAGDARRGNTKLDSRPAARDVPGHGGSRRISSRRRVSPRRRASGVAMARKSPRGGRWLSGKQEIGGQLQDADDPSQRDHAHRSQTAGLESRNRRLIDAGTPCELALRHGGRDPTMADAAGDDVQAELYSGLEDVEAILRWHPDSIGRRAYPGLTPNFAVSFRPLVFRRQTSPAAAGSADGISANTKPTKHESAAPAHRVACPTGRTSAAGDHQRALHAQLVMAAELAHKGVFAGRQGRRPRRGARGPRGPRGPARRSRRPRRTRLTRLTRQSGQVKGKPTVRRSQ